MDDSVSDDDNNNNMKDDITRSIPIAKLKNHLKENIKCAHVSMYHSSIEEYEPERMTNNQITNESETAFSQNKKARISSDEKHTEPVPCEDDRNTAGSSEKPHF